jgi:hypothetical protein
MMKRLTNRSLTITALFAASVLVVASLAGADEGVIGRWRSAQPSSGGIGSIFEFHRGGVVDMSAAAVVEARWRMENGKLILPPATIGGPEQAARVEWRGDNLLSWKLPDGGGEQLTRQGPVVDPKRLIVGEWTGPREMAGRKLEVRWIFYATGKSLLLIPFQMQHGRYSIEGGTIRIEVPGRGPVQGKFRVLGNMLTIPGPNGKGEFQMARY